VTRLQSSIFEALDGHDFEFDGCACHVEVYGVFDEGDHRWVQLALDGYGHQMLTVRLDMEHEKVPATVISKLAGFRATTH